MKTKKENKIQIKFLLNWLFLLIIFIIAVILYLYKINGKWDYTSNFYIRRIESQNENYNIRMVLDNDLKTVWGLLDKRKKGEDHIKIELTQEKFVSGIYINYTNSLNAQPLENIEFLYSSDGNTWNNIYNIELEIENEHSLIKYKFNDGIVLKYLKLTYMSEENAYWPIAELGILFE